MHLGGNMLYLWIFGDNVEESMGRVKFVLFYCLCGAAAALSQMMINPASQIPMVGASGAIRGVSLAPYLILHPKAVIRTFSFDHLCPLHQSSRMACAWHMDRRPVCCGSNGIDK